jgi:hypothetical protein
MKTVRFAAIAAFALITTGASAQEGFIFCGGADTSGHCSAAPRSSVTIVPRNQPRFDERVDRTITSAVPRAQGASSVPSSGGGFVDQSIGPNTSIRGQQAPSPGTTGDLPLGTGSSSSPGTGSGSSLGGGASSGSLQ